MMTAVAVGILATVNWGLDVRKGGWASCCCGGQLGGTSTSTMSMSPVSLMMLFSMAVIVPSGQMMVCVVRFWVIMSSSS